MDTENPTPNRNGKARLVAVIGAAALAIPGGIVVSNALAAGDSSSTSGETTAPIQQSENPYTPAQGERPDGRDCPKEHGGDDQGDSGESAAPSTSPGAEETAL